MSKLESRELSLCMKEIHKFKINFYHVWYLVVMIYQHILNIRMLQFTGLASITQYKQCLIFSLAQKFMYL